MKFLKPCLALLGSTLLTTAALGRLQGGTRRPASPPRPHLQLLFDATSVEVFADHGLTVMTELFFPTSPLTKLTLKVANGLTVQRLTYAKAALAPK
jgi:sucrose-6-phosphate hydrolase SacC (GH32 family)